MICPPCPGNSKSVDRTSTRKPACASTEPTGQSMEGYAAAWRMRGPRRIKRKAGSTSQLPALQCRGWLAAWGPLAHARMRAMPCPRHLHRWLGHNGVMTCHGSTACMGPTCTMHRNALLTWRGRSRPSSLTRPKRSGTWARQRTSSASFFLIGRCSCSSTLDALKSRPRILVWLPHSAACGVDPLLLARRLLLLMHTCLRQKEESASEPTGLLALARPTPHHCTRPYHRLVAIMSPTGCKAR